MRLPVAIVGFDPPEAELLEALLRRDRDAWEPCRIDALSGAQAPRLFIASLHIYQVIILDENNLRAFAAGLPLPEALESCPHTPYCLLVRGPEGEAAATSEVPFPHLSLRRGPSFGARFARFLGFVGGKAREERRRRPPPEDAVAVVPGSETLKHRQNAPAGEEARAKAGFQQRLHDGIGRVSRLILSDQPFREIAENLFRTALDFTASHSGLIGFWDETTACFHVLGGPGCTEEAAGWRGHPQDALPLWVRFFLDIESPKVLMSVPESVASQMPCQGRRQEILAATCRFEGKAVGFLTLCSEHGSKRFDVQDLHLIDEFSRFFTQAVRYENLHRRLKLTLDTYQGFQDANLVGVYHIRFDAPIPLAAPPEQVVEAILRQGRYEYANEAMARMYGLGSGKDIVGKPAAAFFVSPEEGRAAFTGFVRNGYRWNRVPLRQVSAQGHHKIIHNTSFGYTTEGMLARIWGIQADATRETEMERQLAHSLKMEAVGALAGGVAHDFNNILNGILGYTSLLKMDLGESGPALEYVSDIEKQCMKAADLASLLLGFSRRGARNKVPMAMNELVLNVVRIVERSFRKEIRIETDLAPDLTPVEADPAQIEGVIMNICINARDAMPNGGILHIASRNVFLDEDCVRQFIGLTPGDYVLVGIRDTGEGMSEEVMKRIFDPFFTTKKDSGGTGLGLSMVYSTMANHGGTVTVYSQPGQGAEFNLYFKSTPGSPPPTAALAPKPAATTSARGPKSGQGERILFVDDDDIVRETGRRLLEKLGYRVEAAENGRAGLERFRRDPRQFDLVILDMIMPEMSGEAAFWALRDLRPDIRVLIASGFSPNESIQSLLRQRLTAYISKPFLAEGLNVAIRDLLSR